MTLYDKKGHVSRITIRPDGLLLSKDRPSNKSGQESVELAHTGFDFQRGKWYVVLLELSGDEMFARVDDQHFAYGQATGIGRPQDEFPVSGGRQRAVVRQRDGLGRFAQSGVAAEETEVDGACEREQVGRLAPSPARSKLGGEHGVRCQSEISWG